MLFWRKNFEDGNSSSPGFFAAPDFNFLCKPIEKYLAFEPCTAGIGAKMQK
jgi:hypothetical protein